MAKGVVKRIPFALAASLVVGTICVLAAHEALVLIAKPELFMHIAPGSRKGSPTLEFTNIGRKDLLLDTGNMDFFLIPPVEADEAYLLAIGGKGEQDAGKRFDFPPSRLRTGETLRVGNTLPELRRLPPGQKSLTAIYRVREGAPGKPGTWHGVVRSLPAPFDAP